MQMVDGQHRKFIFREALGQGGFGEVYLAEMQVPSGLTSSVAVKVLHGGLDPASQAVRRLTDEGKILSMLNHPAIVAVHDLAIIEGRVALVTEFVEGADLPDCILGDDPMPKGAIYEAIAAVADALKAAHDAVDMEGAPLGLLHRDVKPRNIRVGRHGQVKLLDFGIATGSGIAREAQTGTNALIGSFPYMAPERFKRAELGPASDFYSLGCSLYEMLTGEKLFFQEDVAELLVPKTVPDANAEFLDERFAVLDERAPEVVQLLRALTNIDPAKRPEGAELVGALEDLAADVGGTQLKRWARGHNWSAQTGESGSLTGKVVIESRVSPGVVPSAVGHTVEIDAQELAAGLAVTSSPTHTNTTNLKTGLGAAALLGMGGALFAVVVIGTVVFGLWMRSDTAVDPTTPIGTTVTDPATPPKPGTPEPGTPEPGTPEPGTPEPGTPEPGTPEPGTPEPETPEPGTPEPGTPEPGMPEPGTPEPVQDATKPDDGVAAVDPTDAAALGATACGALNPLEAKAATGRLSNDDRSCLARYARASSMRQVDRIKLGRLVLVDAQARCKSGAGCSDYEREQPWYFEDLEQSDPDMMLAWASHMRKTNRPDQTRRWANRALGRKDSWSGLVWVNRVDALMRLDALAAQDMWNADPRNEDLRNRAKEAAADWASHRARVNRDTKDAMALCRAAAGSDGPCNARVHDNAASAKIVFTTKPAGASLSVDGKSVGVTPLPISLSFGSHEVAVTLDGVSSTHTIEVGTEEPKRWMWTASDNAWTHAF